MSLPPDWQKTAKLNQKKYARFLKQVNVRVVVKQLPALHEEAFREIDCLQCANCCRNHSPRFKIPDIKRIARFLHQKEGDFIQQYLTLDEENDYVLQQQPCAFLGEDNYCSIYEVRPSDCARYPYSDEDVLLKRKSLTLKNAVVCPAVFTILEKLSAL
ncbi:MAG TPA: YkgJ family cysteine cluster protein [Chitinophagaceae bacterium]|nr:YkgJ family cysteine cluster protein [Chitinophagaceae bacterium]